jgi:hypothetical protein
MHLHHLLQLLFLVIHELSQPHLKLLILLLICLFQLPVALVISELLLFIFAPLGAHLFVMDLFEEVEFFAALALYLHGLLLERVLLLPVEVFLGAGFFLQILLFVVVLGLTGLQLRLIVRVDVLDFGLESSDILGQAQLGLHLDHDFVKLRDLCWSGQHVFL